MKTDRPRMSLASFKGTNPRTVWPVAWPGLEVERTVGLMELRCAELQSAYFAARERFARAGLATLDAEAREEFAAELEVQYCARMLVDPEARSPKATVFKDAAECRAELDPDERAYFIARAMELQAKKVASWQPKPEVEGPPEPQGAPA